MACVATTISAFAVSACWAQERSPVTIHIHSVTVDLPPSTDAFPPGPNAELAGKCLICHSAGMVLRQPPLSQEQWKAEINKMRTVYGAPLEDADVEPLSVYLTAIDWKPKSQ
ncbi:cytochrome c [Dyella solisilvae]|uniref:Cytochrome c n=2 Tax=Dyella solisilvae TaxID=1920168 RepID=A0A370KD64_9GAMM|nr:cytochrome c [Dyella solisilvae]